MKFTIYHTNDIHSNFDFMKKVHAFLKANKKHEDLYLDSGDFNDLKSPIVQADMGKSGLELLSSSMLDYTTLGNNEIDMGFEGVAGLLKTKYPLVIANLTDASGNELENTKKSAIIEKCGLRILLIGLAPYYSLSFKAGSYNSFFALGNLMTTDPIKAIRSEMDKNQGKYDYIVVISHSGYQLDQFILSEIGEIGLILGGHSHDMVSNGKLSQSGRGEALGKIVLSKVSGKIEIIENTQIYLQDLESEEFDKLYREKAEFADMVLTKELDVLEELDYDPFGECSFINFICDCLLKDFKADFALMHNGIVDGPLVRPVSKKSILELSPSKLNPTVYPLKGEKIIEAVKNSFDQDFVKQNGKGAGFRGKILGSLGFSSNVKINKEPFSMKINGEEIKPEKVYTLVTDDYLQRGTGYSSLEAPDDESTYDKDFIRDLIEKHLMDKESFESSRIKRIRS